MGYQSAVTYKSTVKYKSGGGKGKMASQTAAAGSTITLKANTFTKKNSVFVGWKASNGKTYKDGAKVKLTRNLKLTAGIGQRIFEDARFARHRLALDDAGFFQLLEPLRQERGRHARQAAAKIVEARRAGEQFAQKNDGPARA